MPRCNDPELLRWLSQHRVPQLLEELIRALMVNKPDMPVRYLRERVEKLYNLTATVTTPPVALKPTPPPPPGRDGAAAAAPCKERYVSLLLTLPETAGLPHMERLRRLRETADQEEKNAAAAKIQALQRGRKARQDAQQQPGASDKAKPDAEPPVGNEEEQAAPEAEDTAATTTPRDLIEAEASSAQDEKDAAAAKIQALQRGRKARQDAEQARQQQQQQQQPGASVEAEPDTEPPVGNEEEQAAPEAEDTAATTTPRDLIEAEATPTDCDVGEAVVLPTYSGQEGRVVEVLGDGAELRVALVETGEEVVVAKKDVEPVLCDLNGTLGGLTAHTEQSSAATKIQALQRGRKARQEAAARKKSLSEPTAAESVPEPEAAAVAEAKEEAPEEPEDAEPDTGVCAGEKVVLPTHDGQEGRVVEVLGDGAELRVALVETGEEVVVAQKDVQPVLCDLNGTLGDLTAHTEHSAAATKIQALQRGRKARQEAAARKKSISEPQATEEPASVPAPASETATAPEPRVPKDPQFVYTVRHGHRIDDAEPSWTSDRPYDPPLTDEGHAAAVVVGSEFAALPAEERPSYVITSPFTRCVETAAGIASALGLREVHVHQQLGEIYNPQVLKCDLQPQLDPPTTVNGVQVTALDSAAPPYPETRDAAFTRYAAAFDALPGLAPDHHVVLVTHGEAVGQSVSSLQPHLTVYSTPYCSYTVRYRGGGGPWVLRTEAAGQVEWMSLDD
eukprot:TRINITY_DN3095_c0_g2_i2.p1 TRINITY_DN3095_c0_g2~~TRINITY_DN3095_c0_g2_i2.p1  ORF type:complete len:733 (+),score=195.67 TRINITY_DN3095_c0_g2_i2:86-2284(+)